MPDDHVLHAVGIQPDLHHLVANGVVAAPAVPVVDVRFLLPPGVVQRDITVLRLDDPDVHREIHEGRVAAIRLEGAVRHVHEAAALDDPRGVLSRVLGWGGVRRQLAVALEALRQRLRRYGLTGLSLAEILVLVIGSQRPCVDEEAERRDC